MIGRVISSIGPAWLIAALLGITVYAGMQARHYALALDGAQAQAARDQQRAEILLEHQRYQRRQIESMTVALTEREEQLDRDNELMSLVRQAARNLERDDAETADWADQPVPDAVRDWLRHLSTASAAADTAMRGDTAIPNEPATGASWSR